MRKPWEGGSGDLDACGAGAREWVWPFAFDEARTLMSASDAALPLSLSFSLLAEIEEVSTAAARLERGANHSLRISGTSSPRRDWRVSWPCLFLL